MVREIVQIVSGLTVMCRQAAVDPVRIDVHGKPYEPRESEIHDTEQPREIEADGKSGPGQQKDRITDDAQNQIGKRQAFPAAFPLFGQSKEYPAD